jgi:uncharacterized coiled-coil protein SlyX
MSKQVKANQPTQSTHQPISLPEAVINLAQRLKILESKSAVQFKTIEEKLGDHENKFIEDAPDLDQVAEMFKLLSSRIDALTTRLEEVEKINDIKPPAKKKGGTVKLTDLEQPNEGISFS